MSTEHQDNIVRGTGCDVRIMHITDSHITTPEDADDQFSSYSNRMHDAYAEYDRFGVFQHQLKVAEESRADLIALTGDIVSYPGPHAVSMIYAALRATGIPWVYTSGNHDWHYEGMRGSSNTKRDTWRDNLAPLYAGHNPHCDQIAIKGLSILLIDNSTYQVDDMQLAFYSKHLAQGVPTILLVHIPLSIASLRRDRPNHPVCGDPNWGAKTDTVWEIERRERWPETGNDISTEHFLSRVISSPNLKAVLCGHIHQQRSDSINKQARQYCGGPGFSGEYGLFYFV